MYSKTVNNLMCAFAGESQAFQRYNMYASIAKKEGYTNLSNIFLETAINEKQHAKIFYDLLCDIVGEEEMAKMVEINASFPIARKSTLENLEFAASGEAEEVDIYAEFAEIAKEEGHKEAAAKFLLIGNVESFHSSRYKEMKKRIEDDKLFEEPIEVSWKCLKCGHIHVSKKAPKICPICSHDQSYFEKCNK